MKLQPHLSRVIVEQSWPGIPIYSRVSGIQRYGQLLNEYVPLMQDQARIRWRAEQSRQPPPDNPAELEERLADLDVVIVHDIGANFYGAFVVSVAACMEASLADICTYIQARERSPLSLNDLREQSTLKRVLKYIEFVLKQPLRSYSPVQRELRDLQNVRNALAHGSGRVTEQRIDRARELEVLAAANCGISILDDHVVVEAEFIRRSMDAVESLLEGALQQLLHCYPTPSSEA